ncbi:MAG: hypothetical protein ACERKO_02385 [Acetanaerobacterium sp.]
MDFTHLIITCWIIGVGVGSLFGIGIYVINAISFYTIAKNRGYNKPWLAWIPIANDYLRGAIADDINYRHQKSTSFRIWLMVLVIISKAGIIGVVVVQTIVTVTGFGNGMGGLSQFAMGGYNQFMMGSPSRTIMMVLPIVALFFGLFSIGYAVIYYFAMYRIYNDYVPHNAVLFLVLSIVVSVTEPFFVLSFRNKPAISIYGAQNPHWQYANRGAQWQPPYGGQYGQGNTPPQNQSGPQQDNGTPGDDTNKPE